VELSGVTDELARIGAFRDVFTGAIVRAEPNRDAACRSPPRLCSSKFPVALLVPSSL
jgi:hypothetical protein